MVVPEVGLLPVHAPLAVQAVALLELHESVELAPFATILGVALRETDGAGTGGGVGLTTDTVTELLAAPLAPAQLMVNVLLAAVSAPLFMEPDVARSPDHAPEAAQLVALALVHVRTVVPFGATVSGSAVSSTVGTPGGGGGAVAACTSTVAERVTLPSAPEQTMV